MSSPSTTWPGVVRFRSPWCTLRDVPLRAPVVLALGNPAIEVVPPAAVPVDVGGGVVAVAEEGGLDGGAAGGGVVAGAEEGGLDGGVAFGEVGRGEPPAGAGDDCTRGAGAPAAAVPDAA